MRNNMLLFNVGPQIAVIAAVLAATAAAGPHPNLSGTWDPDPGASTQTKALKTVVDRNAPPAPPAAASTIVAPLPPVRITLTGDTVTLEFLAGDGSVISTTKMTTDGSESLNSRAGGALVHRSTSVWDGQALRTSWALKQGDTVVISGTDKRELIDPATLQVTTTTEDSKSTSKSVLVYHRRNPSD
jgi:hypothetical protein